MAFQLRKHFLLIWDPCRERERDVDGEERNQEKCVCVCVCVCVCMCGRERLCYACTKSHLQLWSVQCLNFITHRTSYIFTLSYTVPHISSLYNTHCHAYI